MTIRDYTPNDKSACMMIFDSNSPKYFTEQERGEYAEFLDTMTDPYLVVEAGAGQVIACGGYVVQPKQGAGGLSWGMVSRDYHKKGIGRWLLLSRLERLCQDETVFRILLDTSQYTYGFFKKLGFETTKVTKDGYEPGLDTYDMVLRLTNETRQAISQQCLEIDLPNINLRAD